MPTIDTRRRNRSAQAFRRTNRVRGRLKQTENSFYLSRVGDNLWDISDDLGITGGRFRESKAAIRYLQREFGEDVPIIYLRNQEGFTSSLS